MRATARIRRRSAHSTVCSSNGRLPAFILQEQIQNVEGVEQCEYTSPAVHGLDADMENTAMTKNIIDSNFIHRPKIGLALGSGSARGLAHLGVIRAIVDAGFEGDLIAGTSLGGLTRAEARARRRGRGRTPN